MVHPMFSGLIFVNWCLFANRHFCHLVLANLRFVLPPVLTPKAYLQIVLSRTLLFSGCLRFQEASRILPL